MFGRRREKEVPDDLGLTRDTGEREARPASLARFGLTGLNVLFAVSGAALACLSAYAFSEVTHRGALARSPGSWVALTGLCLGLLAAVLAGVGLWGSLKRRPVLLRVYSGVIVCLLVAQVSLVVASVVFRNTSEAELRRSLSAAWSDATAADRSSIQSDLKCCGFGNSTDRVTLPCGGRSGPVKPPSTGGTSSSTSTSATATTGLTGVATTGSTTTGGAPPAVTTAPGTTGSVTHATTAAGASTTTGAKAATTGSSAAVTTTGQAAAATTATTGGSAATKDTAVTTLSTRSSHQNASAPGCYEKLRADFNANLLVLEVSASVVAALQLVGVVVACSLSSSILSQRRRRAQPLSLYGDADEPLVARDTAAQPWYRSRTASEW